MYLSSSMVKSAHNCIFIFFKYWFKDSGGNFFLLDEPESEFTP